MWLGWYPNLSTGRLVWTQDLASSGNNSSIACNLNWGFGCIRFLPYPEMYPFSVISFRTLPQNSCTGSLLFPSSLASSFPQNLFYFLFPGRSNYLTLNLPCNIALLNLWIVAWLSLTLLLISTYNTSREKSQCNDA